MIAPDWKDYEVIATGNGEKLERWGEVYLLRPDPQAIWSPPFDLSTYPGSTPAIFVTATAGASGNT